MWSGSVTLSAGLAIRPHVNVRPHRLRAAFTFERLRAPLPSVRVGVCEKVSENLHIQKKRTSWLRLNKARSFWRVGHRWLLWYEIRFFMRAFAHTVSAVGASSRYDLRPQLNQNESDRYQTAGGQPRHIPGFDPPLVEGPQRCSDGIRPHISSVIYYPIGASPRP